jgi:hypothetical protein
MFGEENMVTLTIRFSLIDVKVLTDLQKAAFAIDMPNPRRKRVRRHPLMELRDKIVYEEAFKGTQYAEIRGVIRTKFPGRPDFLVTPSAYHQAARKYAKRHNLPMPPDRQERRS